MPPASFSISFCFSGSTWDNFPSTSFLDSRSSISSLSAEEKSMQSKVFFTSAEYADFTNATDTSWAVSGPEQAVR